MSSGSSAGVLHILGQTVKSYSLLQSSVTNEVQHVRYFHRQVSSHYTLTSKPRMQCEPVSHIKPVFFVFVHFCEIFLTFFDYYVTSSARTIASARVLEINTKIQRDI